MRSHCLIILACLLIADSFLYSQNVISYRVLEANPVAIREWKINYTDTILWKDTGYNEENWKLLKGNLNLVPSGARVYWIKKKLELSEDSSDSRPLSLFIAFLGSAYEVYWDGCLIGSNGKIGKGYASETTGRTAQIVSIPPGFCTNGKHTIAIRISNHNNYKIKRGAQIGISLSSQITDHISSKNANIMVIASVLFSFALFNLILFWGFNKEVSLLYLSLFSLVLSVKTILESYFILTSFTLKEHLFLMGFVHPFVILSGIFLIAFLVTKFLIPYNKRIIWIYTLLSAISYFIVPARPYIVINMIAAFLISIYAVYLKKEGCILSLIGLIGFALFSYVGYQSSFTYGYFLGIVFFIFCMSISSARQISSGIYLHSRIETRAARLESQLLKKNIQPHFILNSLSSLQELIETSPELASGFIDALADEFRIFSRISNEKLISIKDELKICEAHIKIMGFRKEAEFTLTTKGITGNEMVPPAIFHTMVENGLTHGYGKKNSGVFVLTKEKIENGIVYSLFNDSDPLIFYDPVKKGTGLKYIESRLEESFPDKWSLTSGPATNGWLVSVKIIY